MQAKHKRITISAHPRIHISLIGMNEGGYRVNGGLGFSIASPTMNMVFEVNDSFTIIDQRTNGFTEKELLRLTGFINRLCYSKKFSVKYKCIIEDGLIRSHVGFGSNTIVYMACVEAMFVLNNMDYSFEDIVNCSSRGGTSGIGINTYFNGGFVLDVGIPKELSNGFVPSSCILNSHQLPLVLRQSKLPNWNMGICIPNIKHKSEEQEQDFFKSNCPIDKKYVNEILYEAVYGITSSIIEQDFEIFCQSIDAIQKTKWKSMERNLYGKKLQVIDDELRKAGAKCVGMSSLGPLLYFFGENIPKIIEKMRTNFPDAICYKTSVNNTGRVIKYD